MRRPGGYKYIMEAVNLLEKKHLEHMNVYGEHNKMRMTGFHETSSWDKFTSGVADRTASVRIPRCSFVEGCGYLEDRRPGANANPYDVIVSLAETTVMSADTESYDKFDEDSDTVELSFGALVEKTKTELGVRGVGFKANE